MVVHQACEHRESRLFTLRQEAPKRRILIANVTRLSSPPKSRSMDQENSNEKFKQASESPIITEYVLPEQGKQGLDKHDLTGLKRQLKSRHVAMISIGGVLGTGLFLGTAGALQNGGPIGLLLGYSIVGTICYAVMISLGEMIAYLPISGGHIRLAERFVNPAFSFAMGWFYWYMWVIVMPGELSASVVMINYWARERINDSVWLVVCIVVVVAINLCGAAVYGEAEFIFASIKVITAVGLIILGVVLDLGGGPNHDRIGFRYWKNPGPFVQIADIPGAKGRFLGWWSVMIQAAFSYLGTEIISITAGEAKNPRRSLPKAIRGVYVRIQLFYICGTLVIGLLVPSNHPDLSLADGTAAASPFVIAIETAGIKILPSIINAALVTSSWSGANCDLYTSSRSLYGLAVSGNAPSVFRRVNRNGLPYVSVIFCSLFTTLSFMSINSGAGRVFGWLANLSAVTGMLTWLGICFIYLQFYSGIKAQGIDRSTLPFSSPLQPYAAWYGVISCTTVCLLSGWQVFLRDSWATDAFVTNYLPLVIFPTLYIIGRVLHRRALVNLHEMDFKTGVDEAIADSYDESPPKNVWEKFWMWLA